MDMELFSAFLLREDIVWLVQAARVSSIPTARSICSFLLGNFSGHREQQLLAHIWMYPGCTGRR